MLSSLWKGSSAVPALLPPETSPGCSQLLLFLFSDAFHAFHLSILQPDQALLNTTSINHQVNASLMQVPRALQPLHLPFPDSDRGQVPQFKVCDCKLP